MNEMFDVLLQLSLRACVAAAGVGLALTAFRVRSAALRHAAWTAVLGAMLLMAPLRVWLPAIPVSTGLAAPEQFSYATNPQASQPIPAPATAQPAPHTAAATPPSPIRTAAKPPFPWLDIALAAYLIGLAASLARLFLGWLAAREFARSCQPAGPRFYQSARTVTPFTAGVLVPRVVLPADWRSWPAPKLRAVLAHEAAHAQRHDNLVNAIALLNRAIFWFHPLAWWLQRTLATLAEHACDDAAIATAGGTRGYAEVLLDLADSARRHGGRLLWQSGMAGSGRVEARIDRILNSVSEPRTSRTKRLLVALVCSAAILFAAACQRQTAVTPLRDNRLPNVLFMNNKALLAEARAMTAEQAEALETEVAKNPQDLAGRTKLLTFYRAKGAAELGEAKTIAARRRHILWLIANHPESALLSSELLLPTNRDPLADPVGYAQAKKLWLAQTARADTSPRVLGNAAAFLIADDKPLAEKLLLRAQLRDPRGGWSEQLGWLYYPALVGSNASMPMGVVRSVSLADAHGEFAADVRRKLAESSDARMLTSAGLELTLRGHDLYLRHTIDFDPLPLGKQYLERALTIDPQSLRAHEGMVYARRVENDPGWRALPESQRYQAIAKLPENQRFLALPELAEAQYHRADTLEYREHNAAAAKPYWDDVKKFAQGSLDLSKKFTGDADYGTAFYNDHMLLGLAAMRDGDRKLAIQQMLTAAEAPSTEALAYTHQMATYRLPAWLLKDGEREPVIRFINRFAMTNIAGSWMLRDSAAAIQAGQKPSWYFY